MTANQIAYSKAQEDKRHNAEVERLNQATLAETERANRAREGYNLTALAETSRHNLESEKLGQATLAETGRHNAAQESYNLSYLAEVSRHNYAQESISAANLDETVRHNKTVEVETERHNTAEEVIGVSKWGDTLIKLIPWLVAAGYHLPTSGSSDPGSTPPDGGTPVPIGVVDKDSGTKNNKDKSKKIDPNIIRLPEPSKAVDIIATAGTALLAGFALRGGAGSKLVETSIMDESSLRKVN